MNKLLPILCLAILVISLGTMACGPKETELPFETIEQRDWTGHEGKQPYSGEEPRLVLVNGRDEIERLEKLVTQEALDQMAILDFGQYFALAVFRGRQPTTGYDIIIERVARRDDKIVVHAQFWEPNPGHYVFKPMVRSPYHLVKVRRDGSVIQETKLVLQSRAVTPTPPSR
jgi:hypothetical protein